MHKPNKKAFNIPGIDKPQCALASYLGYDPMVTDRSFMPKKLSGNVGINRYEHKGCIYEVKCSPEPFSKDTIESSSVSFNGTIWDIGLVEGSEKPARNGYFTTYEVILEGYKVASYSEVQAFVKGFMFSECDVKEQRIKYSTLVEVIEGIVIYYDYGADYYFFCPESEEGSNHVAN
jgi:hypothetical protein